MTKELRRAAVVGVGAVGGYFGGRLACTKLEVHFIARGATLSALAQHGLRVESPRGDFTIGPTELRCAEQPSVVGPVDVVLLAVKAWQVRAVAASLQPLLHAGTVILPLQNGVDAQAELRDVLPHAEVLGGLCRIMAQATAPGVIRHFAAEPEILLGPLTSTARESAEALCSALRSAGVRTEIPADITAAMWEKLVFIASFGAVGAVARAPLGALRSCEKTMRLIESAMDEIIAVAHGYRIGVSPALRERVLSYLAALPDDGTSSLQRDMAAGRPSELEALVGSVVRHGQALSVPTPVFEFLYASLLPSERIARKT